MEKITIHRALAELKIIDSRIDKNITNLVPVGLYQTDKPVNNLYDKKDFEDNAKSKKQSLSDLIERKVKLKQAIVKANSITEVKVAGQTMTIADAIHMKETIAFKKELSESLESFYRRAKLEMEKKNAEVDERALRIAVQALQKDNVKLTDKDAINVTEPYLKINRYHLCDPLKIEKLIGQLNEEIDKFETDIDATLSEANAMTTIEI